MGDRTSEGEEQEEEPDMEEEDEDVSCDVLKLIVNVKISSTLNCRSLTKSFRYPMRLLSTMELSLSRRLAWIPREHEWSREAMTMK